VTVTYHTASSGSGTVELAATWPSGNLARGAVTVTIWSATPSLTASPTTQYTAENVTTNYPWFQLTNNGTVTGTYTAAIQTCSGNISSCSVRAQPPSLAVHGSTTLIVDYHVGPATGGNGTITLRVTSQYGEVATATVTVVPLSEAVSVATQTPPTAPAPPGGTASYGFTVSAVGNNTSPITYALTASCSGAVSCSATPSPSTVTITPGSPASASVVATATSNLAGGSGTVSLSASYTNSWGQVYSSQASYSVAVPDVRTATVTVTPKNDSTTYNEANVATNVVFTVRNVGNTSATYTMTQPTACTGAASGCVIRSGYTSVTLGPGQSSIVPVDYTTGPVGQTAYLSLAASVTAWGRSYSDNGSASVVPLAPTVQVTSASGPLTLQTNSSGAAQFHVHNAGNDGTITYTLTVTSCAAPLTQCTAPASVAVAQGADSIVTVALQAGPTSNGGSQTTAVTLEASKQFTNRYASSATTTVTVSPHLTVSTAFMNNDDQDGGLCAAACFALETARSTVPYYTLDTPRSVTLSYNSDRFLPKPFVYADVTVTTPPATVTGYTLEVERNGVALPFTNGESVLHFQGTGTLPYRLAGQLDLSTYGTGMYPATVVVTALYANNTSDVTTTAITLLVVNTQYSPIGKGWSIAGVPQLVMQSDSSALIVRGDGSATYFVKPAGNGTGYLSPSGVYSSLAARAGGAGWVETALDNTRVWYGPAGRVDSVTDRLGFTTRFMYDGSGRLTGIVDPMLVRSVGQARATTVLTYGAAGLASIQEPNPVATSGRITYVHVTADSVLRAVVDPDGDSTSYGYDTSERLTTITDRNGATTTYAYGPLGKLTTITAPAVPIDAGGGSTTMQQPLTTLQPWQTVGVPTTATVSNPAAPVRADLIWAMVTDPNSAVTTFQVDRWGQPLLVRGPVGAETTIQRSGRFPSVVTGPDGGVDSLTFTNGLLTSARSAGQRRVFYHYGADAQPDSIWGGGYSERRFLNPVTANVDSLVHTGPAPNVVRYAYDGYGRLQGVTDEAGHRTQRFYDAIWGNTNSTALANGTLSRVTLDARGRDSVAADGVDSSVTTVYDSVGRPLWSARGANGKRIQLTYDAERLTDVQDRNGNITHTDYNALGWPTQRCDALLRCTTYRYDRDGHVTSLTNRRGQQLAFTYDGLGRLLTKAGDGASTDTFSYASDFLGVVASNSVETDSVRRVVGTSVRGAADTVVTWIGGARYQVIHGDLGSWAGQDSTIITANTGVTFRTRYVTSDPATGMVTALNDGFTTTTYAYTNERLQSTVSSAYGTRNTGYLPTHVPTVTNFDNANLRLSFSRLLHYDPVLRIDHSFSARMYSDGNAGTVYAFDSAGRLALADSEAGCDSIAAGDTISGAMFVGCSSVASTSYAYDAEGNRTSQVGSYGAGNRVLQFNGDTYTVDRDGNVLTDQNGTTGTARTYGWSGDGRLTDVTLNYPGGLTTTVHYEYNALGEPVRRTVNGAVDRVWLYDRGELLAEFNPAQGNQRVAEYVRGVGLDAPIAVITGATAPTAIQYLERDAQGDVVGAHSGTTVTMEVDYDAWGATTTGFGSRVGRLLWKGLQYDEYTGLYYARARWYDPAAGRFLSEDPAGLAGGVNLYTFAHDDPVNGADPSGLSSGFAGGGVFEFPGCGLYCQFLSGALHPRGKRGLPPVPPPGMPVGKYPGDAHIGGLFGQVNAGLGIAGTTLEFGGEERAIGSNFRLYTSAFHGNQYVAVADLAKVGELVGHGTAFAGIGIDIYGAVRGSESFGKAALNIGVGVGSVAGGPLAAGGAALYFGVDAFYPGGWVGVLNMAGSLQAQNEAVLGPSFNLYHSP